MTALRIAALLAALAAAGCSGIYLGDNPGPDVAKQKGPLTLPPALTRP